MAGISTLGQSIDQLSRIKDLQVSFDDLGRQIATGRKTNQFKGLGVGLLPSVKARAEFEAIETYTTNIITAERRISLIQTSIEEFQQQAGFLEQALSTETQSGEVDLETVGDLANNLYGFLVDLLNTQDGERFLFAGGASDNQPIDDNGVAATFHRSIVNDWINGTIDSDQMIDQFRSTLDTTLEYNAPLSSGNTRDVFVRIDENTELNYTVLANEEGFKNILIAASVLREMTNSLNGVTFSDEGDPPAGVYAPGTTQQERSDNFFAIWNDLTSLINQGLDDLDQERFQLSQTQANLATIKEDQAFAQNNLQTIISNAEEIDLNEAAVKLNQIRNTLEATYRTTSIVRQLSLTNFL